MGPYIMGIGNRLQELGRFLDECERRGEAVDDVDVAAITGVEADRLTANLEVTLSIDPTADRTALRDPRVGPDGTVRFALASTTELTPATDHDVAARPTGADLGADGTVTVTLAATVPADGPRADGFDPAVEADGDAETGNAEVAADVADVDAAVSEDDADAGAAEDDATETALPTVAGSETAEPGEPADADTSATASSVDGQAASVDARTDPDDRETATTFTSDRDVPPFKDPDLLAEVYEACGTFAEMADALEMDVTGETVRRYMIDYDIHEPNTYRTGDAADDADDRRDDATSATGPSTETDRPASDSDSRDVDHPTPSADADQPVVLSDGIGLPEDVTVDALIETVMRSNTIYEVKRDVDVDREDALELLRELNLLEFVVGQLATEGERETTREDIIECLRESSAAQ
ncbi:hypothetical protein SAMN05216564_101545 [Halopenitus persicus]|uniref:Uncharacterized protein n=2 Tax=Halopenitus persicus TaxID=1048396 RepID=A0A1H3EQ26_9EURY|nr:hypothetical protein SAMN05216564_101545 [Halopenitus persicus]